MNVNDTRLAQTHVRHGRRFHGTESDYGLPNDEEEYSRLDHQHEAIKLILGSNYTAPLAQLNSGTGPKKILDVASGSGVWIVEVAQEFPNAQLVGMDMSESLLPGSRIPPNVSFIVADITKPFPFEDQSFDVVQMRIVPSIRERSRIYGEIHRVLRPGGIIQLVEIGGNVSRLGHKPPAMDECDRAITLSGHKNPSNRSQPEGKSPGAATKNEDWSIATRISQDLRDTPFMWTSIVEDKITVPVGVWTDDEAGQRAGQLMKGCVVDLMKGFRPNFIDNGGLTGEQVDDMVRRLASELEEGSKWQLETPYHFVWAKKN